MHNDGKNYESFVGRLQQALIDSEPYTKQKNIKIELNKKIIDNFNNEREFDIYWEYELAGITYKTVIECKDYNSRVTIEKIDALIGKIRDLPDIKALFATKVGYQKGAKNKANQNKIDLLIVREQNEADWVDEDGTPLLKTININLMAHLPAEILEFIPCIDGRWAEQNTNLDVTKSIQISGLNSEIYIEDLENDNKFSLLDLGAILKSQNKNNYGIFEAEEIFQDAYIYFGGFKLKLKSYKVKYLLAKPIHQPILIDFSKELVGVIEYLGKGNKRSIFSNGVIRESKINEN